MVTNEGIMVLNDMTKSRPDRIITAPDGIATVLR